MYLYTYKYLPPPQPVGPERGPVSVHLPGGVPKWIGGLGVCALVCTHIYVVFRFHFTGLSSIIYPASHCKNLHRCHRYP